MKNIVTNAVLATAMVGILAAPMTADAGKKERRILGYGLGALAIGAMANSYHNSYDYYPSYYTGSYYYPSQSYGYYPSHSYGYSYPSYSYSYPSYNYGYYYY